MAIPNTSKVPIGTVLEGKFRLTREIGRGGMAAVYEAENIDIGKRVAVKILAAELITSRVVRERFIREARAAAAIRSPHICDVYDSGMYEDRPFLVMELLEGESLYDMMTRVRQLDVQVLVRIITQSARGLAKAHESNVVHRDLKPENIFLTQDEDGKLLAKILDFGLAKFYEQTGPDAASVRLTREGALFGTPAYMSPEQAKGQGEVDHRADLWALGCIVYECLTGQTVWNVEQGVAMILAQIASAPLPRPGKLRPDLPATFDAWFERALDRDPNKRFQSAREFSETLSEALSASKDSGLHRVNTLQSDPEPTVVDPPATEPILLREPVRDSPPLTSPPNPPLALDNERSGKNSSVRAISGLMIAAALALGGYASWLYLLHPPDTTTTLPKTPELTSSPRSKRANTTKVASATRTSYLETLSEAQNLLASEPARALSLFKEAFANGNMPAARSLLTQATIAQEEGGECRVTGLSRPRPFDLEAPVSRPTIVSTPQGSLVSWVDNHVDTKRRQAHTVLLDRAMRRISAPVSVTPDAHNVEKALIVPTAERFGLLYWDDGGGKEGKDAGVYTRMLDKEGKIESGAIRLSSRRRGEHFPTIAGLPGGDFLAIWEEEYVSGSSDLVARRLGPDLKPKGPVVRLTGLFASSGSRRQPRTVDAAVARGKLYLTFAVELGAEKSQIMLQTIPLSDPGLETGLVIRSAKGRSRKKKVDEHLGTLKAVSEPNGKNAQPHIACDDDGCFITWDDEKNGGAFMSFWNDQRGQLWQRQFAAKGKRPMLGRDGQRMIVGYYEDSRVKLARLSREGVGKANVVSRINGFQPNPEITPGEKPGQWYVAFRDFESAHLEIFALRAECP